MVLLQFTSRDFIYFPLELLRVIIKCFLADNEDIEKTIMYGNNKGEIFYPFKRSDGTLIIQRKYTGEVFGWRREGYGTLQYLNNDRIFEGHFRNDKLIKGKLYQNGSIIEGPLKNGRFHGEGTALYRSGTTYKGEFKGGVMNGYGIAYSAAGYVYKGEFQKDQKHGKGVLYYPDGRIFEGHFRNNKFNGPCVIRLVNGDLFEGSVKGENPSESSNHDIVEAKFYSINSSSSTNTSDGKFILVRGRYELLKGIYTSANGDRYEGELKSEKKPKNDF